MKCSCQRGLADTAPAIDSLFLYTARAFDADTLLQNNLHRWYDAAVGRWLSEDPVGFEGGDLNLCRCVHNRTAVLVDPLGLLRQGLSTTSAIDHVKTLIRRLESQYGDRPEYVVVSPIRFAPWPDGVHKTEEGIRGVILAAQDQLEEAYVADECACVGVLEIVSHGNHRRVLLESRDKKHPEPKSINAGNVEAIGRKLRANIDFCHECVIVLTACNAGNQKSLGLGFWLAAASGCEVIGAGGYVQEEARSLMPQIGIKRLLMNKSYHEHFRHRINEIKRRSHMDPPGVYPPLVRQQIGVLERWIWESDDSRDDWWYLYQ
jgi:RHS repeat-associated protein